MLAVSLACPWAHRTLIVRALKGLEKAISYTVVDYHLDGERGWSFTSDKPKCEADPVHGFERMRQVYGQSHTHTNSAGTGWLCARSVTMALLSLHSSTLVILWHRLALCDWLALALVPAQS